jgi:hypothetical protein
MFSILLVQKVQKVHRLDRIKLGGRKAALINVVLHHDIIHHLYGGVILTFYKTSKRNRAGVRDPHANLLQRPS